MHTFSTGNAISWRVIALTGLISTSGHLGSFDFFVVELVIINLKRLTHLEVFSFSSESDNKILSAPC